MIHPALKPFIAEKRDPFLLAKRFSYVDIVAMAVLVQLFRHFV